MKKFVAVLAAVLLAILAVVPMASASGTTMYVYTASGQGVRLRKGASTDTKTIMTLGVGKRVTVTDTNADNGFYAVSVNVEGKTYNGYMKGEFLIKSDPAKMKQTFHEVTPFTVKIRRAKKTNTVSLWSTTSRADGNKIRDLGTDELLTVTEASRAWYKVTDANGNTGYVVKGYVKQVRS